VHRLLNRRRQGLFVPIVAYAGATSTQMRRLPARRLHQWPRRQSLRFDLPGWDEKTKNLIICNLCAGEGVLQRNARHNERGTRFGNGVVSTDC
jgi:hypothetical protein